MFFVMLVIGVGQVQAEPNAGIYVTTFDDEINVDNDCSLREAIKAANQNIAVDQCAAGSSGSTDDIYLQTGTYLLGIPGQDEDLGASGDLDIWSAMNIHGNGVNQSIIHGAGLDRVFHVLGVGTTVSISGVTIRNGEIDTGAEGGGGLLADYNTNVTLSNCLITKNDTPNSLGGGVDNYLGTVTISDCTISDNSAEEGGGVYSDGLIFIYRTLITDNDANVHGGGVKISEPNGQALLENVTITMNNCNVGSGIYTNRQINMTNVTLTKNVGLGPGFANNGTANLKNTIFSDQFGGPNCSGNEEDFNSAGYNISKDNSCHLNDIHDLENTDPLLDTSGLQDNGGPTLTYALQQESPAVDGGTNTGCPATDQRGYSRPRDGDGDVVSTCDIGAFEMFPLISFPLIFK